MDLTSIIPKEQILNLNLTAEKCWHWTKFLIYFSVWLKNKITNQACRQKNQREINIFFCRFTTFDITFKMFTVIYILASLIVIYNIYLACVEQCRTLLRITKNCLHNFLLYYLKIHEQIFENLRILLFLFYNVCIEKMRSAHKALRMVYKVTSKTSFLNFRDLHLVNILFRCGF